MSMLLATLIVGRVVGTIDVLPYCEYLILHIHGSGWCVSVGVRRGDMKKFHRLYTCDLKWSNA